MMDLGDIGGNIAHGLYIASLAGTWMALVFGFARLREREGRLSFRPRLPRGWRRLCFRLRVQQQTLEVGVRTNEVHYTLVSGSGLELHHESHAVRVDPAAPLVRPQPAVRAAQADSSMVGRR